jgi:DUF1680 family protein
MKMYCKYSISYNFIIIILLITGCRKKIIEHDYPIIPVDFTQVTVEDAFWKPKLETNRKVTIPYGFKMCETTGRIDNFSIAAGLKPGSFCSKFPFDDSDVYKIIEGASYSLSQHYDPDLDEYLDSLIYKISMAQEEDGYLQTWRIIDPNSPGEQWWGDSARWTGLMHGHELYNVGHMYEAAVAHYKATGKKTLFNVALKNADLVVNTFGTDKKVAVPGHEEIEIGLIKLYRVTGNRDYLDMAKFFVDQRGISLERELWGIYHQDHKPVREQTEAVGHAVRAVYLYSAMADLAAISGDRSYLPALEKIWEGIVYQKLYLTGGIGASRQGESFGAPYHLPNADAYSETCAGIAMIFWNYRMFLLTGEAKYIDVLERSLYNNVIAGVSHSGDRFFYPNPLESDGITPFNHGLATRQNWFPCACCPSNVSRILPSIPGYMYAVKEDTLYVNLYIKSKTNLLIENQDLSIQQDTNYPRNGEISLKVSYAGKKSLVVAVRIPGWSMHQPLPGDLYHYINPDMKLKPEILLNNKKIDLSVQNGYVYISKAWSEKDDLKILLPMPVRKVFSNESVIENVNKVALERGPLVYSFEEIDNKDDFEGLNISDGSVLNYGFNPLLLDGIDMIYVENPDNKYVAIPYHKWSNRGEGKMKVWVPSTRDQ